MYKKKTTELFFPGRFFNKNKNQYRKTTNEKSVIKSLGWKRQNFRWFCIPNFFFLRSPKICILHFGCKEYISVLRWVSMGTGMRLLHRCWSHCPVVMRTSSIILLSHHVEWRTHTVMMAPRTRWLRHRYYPARWPRWWARGLTIIWLSCWLAAQCTFTEITQKKKKSTLNLLFHHTTILTHLKTIYCI